MDFVSSFIVLIIGYMIGSISIAIIISKYFKKEDIRLKGSGNAGATNITRNYGKKIGFIVLLGDLLKPCISSFIAFCLKEYTNSDLLNGLIVQVAAIGAVIGHIYPIYFKFKGGKGAATIAGFFLAMHWLLFIIGIILFIVIYYSTKKVSLASIIIPFTLIIFQISFSFIPYMNGQYFNPMMQNPMWWVNTISLLIVWCLSVFKHKDNIKRLLSGTENTFR